jgi:hypothetical protein
LGKRGASSGERNEDSKEDDLSEDEEDEDKKPRKFKRNRPIAKGSTIPGPIPLKPSRGRVKVDHRKRLGTRAGQRRILNGTVTTAYLNALVRSHHHAGVRRSSDSFVQIIKNEHTKHGSYGGFSASLVELNRCKQETTL